MFFKELI